MTYTQLSQNERYQISALLTAGCCKSAIAEQLKRNRSTIDREIARCGDIQSYNPEHAHSQAMQRQKASRNAKCIAPSRWAHVRCYLLLKLSPQQVCGRLLAEEVAPPSGGG